MPKKNVEPAQAEEVSLPIPDEPNEVAPEKPKYQSARFINESDVPAQKMPDIRAGVCEFCGPGEYDSTKSPNVLVKDYTVDVKTQMGRCEHYSGVKVRCVYCPLNADWENNIMHRVHKVFISPPGSNILIMVCDDMNCRSKHLERAKGGR